MPTDSFGHAPSIEARLPRSSLPVLPELLSTPYDDALLREQILQTDGDKVRRVAILSFRSLQLYRIAKLQAALVKRQNAIMNPLIQDACPRSKANFSGKEGRLGTDLQNEEGEGREIDDLLQRYADAIRNYETLSQKVRFDKHITYDFLGGKGEFKVIERTNMCEWGPPEWLQRSNPESTLPLYSIGPLGFRELDKGRMLERSLREKIKSRFHMALLGGVALIAPVILMTLKPTLIVDLVTVSVTTAIFSLAIVIFATDASGKDVLTATAGYAAVMVVFLGTSLQVISQN
ncbi:hypothetical protein F5Y07DRAFT_368411 [Xylaria sp. FL0933]|nr:hypothetical protein F5Y07DRAFT_368411 [Xylaria sp. FL0933]